MTFHKRAIFLAWIILATLTSASCQEKKAKNYNGLPKPIGFVNDFDNAFTADQVHFLDSMIHAFEKRTTIQFAVIMINPSMTTADSVDAFTLKLANGWGVGQKDKNNGVTIGISRAYRKMRIANGYGIEKVLTDEETKKIMDSTFIPRFHDGKYFEGVYSGLQALMKTLEARMK